MTQIRPFHGVRYDPAVVGDLARVVAAPFDIITPAAQDDYYARSIYNVVRLELGVEKPDDIPTDNRYTRAAAIYREWRRSGVLRPEAEAAFYVYDEVVGDGSARVVRRSLLAPVRLANWEENVVLPHEYTLPKAKADRLQLLSTTHTQFSPILSMYDDPGGVVQALGKAASRPPVAELTLAPGDVAAAARTHRLWAVTSSDLEAELRSAFAPLQIYVADGHHRYETALAYRDQQRRDGASPEAASEYVLMALVETSSPGLLLFPTHRLLRDVDAAARERLLGMLPTWFELEARRIEGDDSTALRNAVESMGRVAATSARPSLVALGLQPGVVHRLTLRPDVDLDRDLPNVPSVMRDLDAVLLQHLILERGLGLSPDEIEGNRRLQYSRDPEEALAAFTSGDAPLVFFLSPTPVGKIRDAVRAGVRMPQKTTYFYPKPVTGLVFFDHQAAW